MCYRYIKGINIIIDYDEGVFFICDMWVHCTF